MNICRLLIYTLLVVKTTAAASQQVNKYYRTRRRKGNKSTTRPKPVKITTWRPTSSRPTARPTPAKRKTANPPNATSTLVPSTNAQCPNGFICLENEYFGSDDKGMFNVDLSLEISSTLDSAQYRAAYVEARSKWMEVITGDLSSISTNSFTSIAPGDCANKLPISIDDLHICGRDLPKDGIGGILGSAGPRWLRTDSTTRKVSTVTGQMQFDTFDLDRMVNDGTIYGVILHEMGHIIGIGTLWDDNGLLDTNKDCLINTRATAVWTNDWDCIGTPPVEKDYGPGTRYGHWDEYCLGDELMTGIASGNFSFSNLTIASLEDLGYKVNYGAAGAFDGNNSRCCKGTAPSLTQNTRTLSDAGRDYAVAYGQEILRENELPDDAALLLAQDDTGLTYVGDKIIVVLAIENGIIFEVFVTK
ncbi:hypothetical protein ACHAW5_002500 [Stephanodiscus triporus]|uniref:Uncharacterized protein n=1 Tax=Stephanodiscus triporus TaxID=2934178 RepID=A0ABD3R196_9STRA